MYLSFHRDGFLAGKAHGQQGKAVAVHQVHGGLFVLSSGVLGLVEHFEESAILRRQIFDGAEHIFMLFSESFGNVPAGCHRFAVLGG